ncbi:hypothetical protein QUF70_05830 [Desulfobacterales bacterium HSG17]|nr:hypothetical protein [Desulfobacterales bacterium HSG17]
MVGYLPKKDLIFFIPGTSGNVFVTPAKRYITVQQLVKAQEFLIHEAKTPVIYIEDRRVKPRSQY